jgi:hypothetical protein
MCPNARFILYICHTDTPHNWCSKINQINYQTPAKHHRSNIVMLNSKNITSFPDNDGHIKQHISGLVDQYYIYNVQIIRMWVMQSFRYTETHRDEMLTYSVLTSRLCQLWDLAKNWRHSLRLNDWLVEMRFLSIQCLW